MYRKISEKISTGKQRAFMTERISSHGSKSWLSKKVDGKREDRLGKVTPGERELNSECMKWIWVLVGSVI